MKRLSYKERIVIPLIGDPEMEFFTKSGLCLANGYVRVVIGKRGPYIEFSDDQICHKNIYVPKHARHKLEAVFTYYHEYRSTDNCFVKLYYQKAGVQYADYQVNMWYISPDDLITKEFHDLVLPLYPDCPTYSDVEEPKRSEEPKKSPSLFDIL